MSYFYKVFTFFWCLELNHNAVLLFVNIIIASNDKVGALGFSLKNQSNFAKSFSLIKLDFGTGFVSTVSSSDGL